jgi:anti-anti-sigma regulatory factor
MAERPYGGSLAERAVTKGDPMRTSAVEVGTRSDGTVVLCLHGRLGEDMAVELRQVVVHAVRKIRPLRLVLDLTNVSALDPINLGTVAAACQLGDDHQVVVMIEISSAALAERLITAGVPPQRLADLIPVISPPVAG